MPIERLFVLILCAAVASAAPLAWTKIIPSGAVQPQPRGAAAIGYDSYRHRLILFGGKNGGSIYDDTWQFNLTDRAWSQLNPTTKPEARFSVVFGTDSRNGRLIVATGQGAGSGVFFNDVWSFDFATNSWFESTPPPPSGDQPAIRYGAAGGISPHSSNNGTLFVSHGFYGETRLSDTYGVNPAMTTTTSGQYADAGPTSGSIPFARCLVASAVLGPIGSEQLVMWGGCGSLGHGPCPARDTWRYDQRTRYWTEVSKCPGPRNRASMSVWPSDTTTLPAPGGDNGLNAANSVVLFGGSGGIWGSGQSGEVNLLNVNTGDWERLQPVASDLVIGLPSRVPWPAMIALPHYHSAPGSNPSSINSNRACVIVFGGDNSNDMWMLSGTPSDTDRLSCPYVFPLREFHGALMFTSWGVLLPLGVIFARYLKGINPPDRWFMVHRTVQSTGVILSIGGFISAVLMVPIHPFKLAHHFIGIIVFVIGILQPINAFFRPHPQPKTTARIAWEHLHKWCGRVGIVLGMINVMIGLVLLKAIAWIVVYSIWVVVLIGFVLMKEIGGYPTAPPAAAATPKTEQFTKPDPTSAVPLSDAPKLVHSS